MTPGPTRRQDSISPTHAHSTEPTAPHSDRLCLRPIPRERDLDRSTFQRRYMQTERPVILENLAAEWPALRKWTIEYLAQQRGRREVKIYDSSFGAPGSNYMNAVRSVPFGEYLKLVLGGRHDARMFLYNIAKEIPQLAADVRMPLIADRFSRRFLFLFAGCAGSTTPIHYDIDMAHVFHTPLVGTRRITLIPPGDSHNLYRHPFTVRSYIDVDAPDFAKYPRLRMVRGYQARLLPGETLFIPSQFWHYVEYEQGGYSISLRCRHQRLRTRLKGYFYLGVLSPIDRLLNAWYGQRWFAWKDKRAHAGDAAPRVSQGSVGII